jgi:hypothetical protein
MSLLPRFPPECLSCHICDINIVLATFVKIDVSIATFCNVWYSILYSLCSKVWLSSYVVGIDWVYSLLLTKKSLSLLYIGGHKEEETYRENPILMSNGPWEQLLQDPDSWIVNRNKALRLSLVLHDMPAKYPKDLPRFNGDDTFTPEEHITTFQDYSDCLEIEHDDVFMRKFCHSLTGDARSWFRDLAADSITS